MRRDVHEAARGKWRAILRLLGFARKHLLDELMEDNTALAPTLDRRLWLRFQSRAVQVSRNQIRLFVRKHRP